MGNWTVNFEQRMRLQLTDLACAVIEEDSAAFQVKSPSDFLCRVFENYYEDAQASIGRQLARQTQMLEQLLDESRLECPAVLQLLEKETKKKLLRQCEIPEKDGMIPIRIQNNTLDKLLDCEDFEGAYYSRPGLYFVAVIEQYCRLDGRLREQIYYKQRHERIQSAIEGGWQLKVTTQNGKTYLVHPVRLLTDKLANAWYLAGYSRKPGQSIKEKSVASFRVSALEQVEVTREKASLPETLRKDMDKLLRSRGVQFLVAQQEQIMVRMTQEGAKKYSRISTLRPACRKKTGDIWEFNCTQLQAKRYFIRLGADCEILSPESLRQEIAQELESAAKLYKKE